MAAFYWSVGFTLLQVVTPRVIHPRSLQPRHLRAFHVIFNLFPQISRLSTVLHRSDVVLLCRAPYLCVPKFTTARRCWISRTQSTVNWNVRHEKSIRKSFAQVDQKTWGSCGQDYTHSHWLIILYVVYKYCRCFSLPNHEPNVNKSLDSEWLPFIEA
jgi:hypothetical protein